MPTSIKTFIYILLVFSIALSSCGVKGPDPIPWAEPGIITDMKSVAQNNVEIKDTFVIDGPITEYYSGNNKTRINISTPWREVDFEIVNNEYYLSCGGYGGTRKKIENGVAITRDFEIKAKTLEDAREKYDSAQTDTSSGVMWAIGGGILACGLAIGLVALSTWLFPPSSAATAPNAFAACGVAGVTGIVGGGVGAFGVGETRESSAREKLESAEADLQALMQDYCP